jgi:hypothetical protein
MATARDPPPSAGASDAEIAAHAPSGLAWQKEKKEKKKSFFKK